MRWTLMLVVLVLVSGGVTYAQHGTAPTGYYPMGYNGDMWTGAVTAVNDDTREITLSYEDTKHKKTETFVGVLEDGYEVTTRDGQKHELKVSEIPLGTHLIVLYSPKAKKANGKKIKYYEIFKIQVAPPGKS